MDTAQKLLWLRLGIGTVVILVIGLAAWAIGTNPRSLMVGRGELRASINTPPSDPTGQFVAAVLGNTEDIWDEIFAETGQTYRRPKLRLFSGTEQTPCGDLQSTMVYCPLDERIYLDTSVFRDLRTRFRACTSDKACEFAEAYLIAREVGHHVQNLLGILARVQQQQASGDRDAADRLQVRVELQADCLAGVWANRSNKKRQFLDPDDVDQAMQATAKDNERVRWFINGFQQCTVQACSTFDAAQP